MRKLITGASIILILISLYGLLRTALASHRVKSSSPTAVATTPTPSPNLLLASTMPTPNSSPESPPGPTPVAKLPAEPLAIRVVKHQPDQFRKGALSEEELSAINKAINTIPWSQDANPKAAATADYAAIVKACAKSGVHDLLKDLVTEALSNDYQPNNEAANAAYSTELNSDFENADQSDSSNGKSAGETPPEQGTSVASGLAVTVPPPEVQAKATPPSPAEPTTSAVVTRPKIAHARHHATVRHTVVDVKMRLLELWHQSLAKTDKSPK
jgi:hypothetical protein